MEIIIYILSPFLLILLAERLYKHPDFFFWLFLNLFFDPGGIVKSTIGVNIIGRVNTSDMLFFLMIVAYLVKRMNYRLNNANDGYFKKFFFLWGIFTFYYIVIYGGLFPVLDVQAGFVTFLIKRRWFLYAVVMMRMVYFFSFSEKGLEYFYKITLFFGVLCLTLYLVNLVAGVQLLPVRTMVRYRGSESELVRYSMYSLGYFKILFPLGVIAFLLKKRVTLRVQYRKWLYYAAVLVVFTLLITLTRRLYIEVTLLVFVSVILISYLFRTGSVKVFAKAVAISIIFIILIATIFPGYAANIGRIYEDVLSLVTTGVDSEGREDYRMTGEGSLLLVKEMIKENILFGTGYLPVYLDDQESATPTSLFMAVDAASEVPIYLVLFNFGIMGFIMTTLIYIFLIRSLLKFMKLFKERKSEYLNRGTYTFLFAIFAMLDVIGKFTSRFFSIYDDFDVGKAPGRLIVYGIFFALFYKYSIQSKKSSLEPASETELEPALEPALEPKTGGHTVHHEPQEGKKQDE